MGAHEPLPGPGSRRRANGSLESEILSLLQSTGTALTPGDVAARLSAPLAHTTVATTLARLHTRGVLQRRPQGRSYAYSPVTDEPGLTAKHMHQVMDGGKDRQTVLTRFVDELSDDDENLLRRLLGTHE
ncbi:BlaI/MecI/CopY family transcriptional regulator [Streptomyces sp. H39-S7]|uniref:BlaI/MecI/CopY family transcriptional regulator n=1 Tax=Streptomyces sp. H39-S7 TaxID=3004357 RepID=UPI0022AFDC99|nr:BlaI/MecI/CopY family transcriptional regulator [Streptomyces sp. H39-S7]MCZ4124034.1 BlaI/MecI/CopY family transcriptional regulator [Streptomyces sp. H39-S7]